MSYLMVQKEVTKIISRYISRQINLAQNATQQLLILKSQVEELFSVQNVRLKIETERHCSDYSYLIASIGDRSAAFFAGNTPKIIPITDETPNAKITD